MSVEFVRIEDKRIILKTKYDPEIVEKLKGMGGKWNPDEKVWVLPLDSARDLERTFGIKLPKRGEVVYVRISKRGKRKLVIWLPTGEAVILTMSELCRLLTGEKEYARARLLPAKKTQE